MRSKRWLVSGIMAACVAAPWIFACGNDSFSTSSSDASTGSETSTSAEGSLTDASITIDPDAAIFCGSQSAALLCADFDEPDLRTAFVDGVPKIFFADQLVTDAGGFGRAPGESSASALETALGDLPGDAGIESARFGGALSDQPKATHFRLQADLRFNHVGNLSGAGGIALLEISLANNVGVTTYEMTITNGHILLLEFIGGTYTLSIDFGPVPSPSTQWLHFDLAITLGLIKPISASFLGISGNANSGTLNTETQATVELGPVSSGYTGLIDISFDNVLVTTNEDGDDAGPSVMDSGDNG